MGCPADFEEPPVAFADKTVWEFSHCGKQLDEAAHENEIQALAVPS